MKSHKELLDDELESQLKNCTLDPTIFNHEAHIRLAWIHLTKYGLEQDQQNITTQLKAFVTSLGAQSKYHETLTVAAVNIVYHFMQKSDSKSFQEFINKSARLVHDFEGLITAHYRFDIYKNETAKKEYLRPDLIPFD